MRVVLKHTTFKSANISKGGVNVYLLFAIHHWTPY